MTSKENETEPSSRFSPFTSLMFSWRGVFVLGCLLIAMFGLTQRLAAQTTLSTIRGTVTDPSGALIPGTDIVVIDVLTNVSRTMVSDEAGNFEISNLKPGTYRLQAQLAGFKSFIGENLILESSQVRRIDIRLEIGATESQVTVNASAAVIEKEQAKLSAVMSNQQYQDTPFVNRSRFTTMMLLILPGVQPPKGGFGVNIAGLATQITEGMDGAVNDGAVNNLQNMDDVMETKIVTVNNTADVARASHFNLVSKRGSNDFHGQVYYYNSNTAYNARPFFAVSKPRLDLHVFGASASGPILKDRTFYYASWNSIRDPSKNFLQSTVPTELMRVGDFSELLNQKTPVKITDPLTGVQFPGNVIPSSRLIAGSQKVQEKYLPKPNLRGLTANLQWLHPYGPDYYMVNYVTQRIDHKISNKNDLYGRISQNFIPYVLNGSYPALTWTRKRYAYQFVVEDTHVFSPKLVHSFRIGWLKANIKDGDEVDGFTPLRGDQVVADLGIKGVNARGLSATGFPIINITGYNVMSVVPGGRLNQDDIHYADAVNWSVGRHVLKFGADLRKMYNLDDKIPDSSFGNFIFNGSLTGYPYADFLLGLPITSSRLDPLINRKQRGYELGIYVTDSFKVNGRLTLDYGLRWDYFNPGSYKDGLQFNWDPATGNVIVPSAAMDKISPLYPRDKITVVAADVVPSPEKTNFAPRLGVAYRINDRTVVRGGYGIFNEFQGRYPYAQGGGPFQIQESFTNKIVSGQALFVFPNAFPSATGNIPSQSISGYPMDVKNGYIQQFNVSLERQVRDIGFSLSYIGTRSRGLNYNLAINIPKPSLTPFSQNRRPYAQFVGASYTQRDGAVNYDGMMVRAIRKVGIVSFDSHWTWAKNMANYLNLANPYNHLMWNRVNIVARHRVVFNTALRIPIGRGERYLSDMPPAVNAFLGNWRMSSESALQTGSFFSPSFSGKDVSNTNTFSGLPDRIRDGNLSVKQRQLDGWFDLGAFVIPQPGTFGNSGVNILEGPGVHVHNLSVTKAFRLPKESLRLEFGCAIGNLFNHPNFLDPNSNVSLPSAGRVTGVVGVTNFENGYARRIEMRLRILW